MRDPERNLGYLINKTAHLLRAGLSERLAAREITVPQWGVLRDLYRQESLPEEERRMTSAHVASRLHADRPTISGIVARLSAKGLVRTAANPADGRSQLLALTDKARTLVPELTADSDAVLDAALGEIDGNRLRQAVQVLLEMNANLEGRSKSE